MRALEARAASRMVRCGISLCGAKDAPTHQLLLVLDGQGHIRQNGAEVDLVLVLEASLLHARFPLVCKRAGCVVLFEHGHLLAGLFESFQTCLELLLVLLGVFAPHENLNRDLAAFQRLEVRRCIAVSACAA
jgi:hypothetical protein